MDIVSLRLFASRCHLKALWVTRIFPGQVVAHGQEISSRSVLQSNRWTFYQSGQQSLTNHIAVRHAATTAANTEFNVFYRFPHMRFARLVTRMKLYQTAVTVAMVPPAWYAYSASYVGLDVCAGAVGVSTFASLMLYVMSGFLRHLVGFIAISEDKSVVRLSCLNFWGRRQDMYVPLQDIVPLTDLDDNATDVYVTLRRYSTKEQLYLSLKFGQISNIELFNIVLGSVTKT